ncbi:MAG TPA: AraC family transcriptional regulator [Rhodopila sp.]|jgi:AraC family transcriptional activator of mtrCDE
MDWLSHLLAMMPVSGRLDLRCFYGAPWRIDQEAGGAGGMAYHALLAGAAVVEDLGGGVPHRLGAGDILLVPSDSSHRLHDGGGVAAVPSRERLGLNLVFSENDGPGERLDMLCGHFVASEANLRLFRAHLPPLLVVRGGQSVVGAQVAGLLGLMRTEADHESLGGRALLNALSAALFALTLRLASEAVAAPVGLLAAAAHPGLAPALAAMLEAPGRAWTLPALAGVCHMSRATLARHFQRALGRSAAALLLDIRMMAAGDALRVPGRSVGDVAEAVGYQSEAAFQRVFKREMGVTVGRWRRGVMVEK